MSHMDLLQNSNVCVVVKIRNVAVHTHTAFQQQFLLALLSTQADGDHMEHTNAH